MSQKSDRRDFLSYSFVAFTAAGMGAAGYAMKKTWDPLPNVLANSFIDIDLNNLESGKPKTYSWRGKPIFALKKTKNMANSSRDLIINKNRYILVIGLCTHLGCIPYWKDNSWICACHGGIFDYNGINKFGPPPRPLDIVPFSVNNNIVTLGKKGPEYKKILENID